jgi:hypothetical protein
MAGRIRAIIADEVAGRVSPGQLEAQLEDIRHQVAGQILAFRDACEVGVQNLLRQLRPEAIEAESGKQAVTVAGRRPFFHRECWEHFERRHEDLRAADNLYETYFDGAYRSALRRLAAQARSPGASKGGR